jgi:serine/threonine protein kinase/formylglycine-generating enzyme required for sulfatase activity
METIGKYRIEGKLGAGGFGAVYRAIDPAMNRTVAVKVLKVQDDPGMVKRFQAEARTAASLRHPNIVTVFDFGEDDGRLFLVMEYLDGVTLAELIATQAPLSVAEKLSILLEAAKGLKAAHEKGILHRDVKPANIMRLADGSVKLMDFGIARVTGGADTRLTQAGFVMGTPAYMAPEQFTGEGETDALGDIWAYGVVLYELLSGTNPFQAQSPSQIVYRVTMEEPLPLARYVPLIPDRMEGIVRRLLSKRRDRRYQNMEDVCCDLDAVLLEVRRPQIEGLIAQGEDLVRHGRLGEAQDVVRRVLELDQSNEWARRRRGELKEMAQAKAALLHDATTSGLELATQTAPVPPRAKRRWPWAAGIVALIGLSLALYVKMPPGAAGTDATPAIHDKKPPAPAAKKDSATRTRVNPLDGLVYISIPKGSFLMGCSPGDLECAKNEIPPHKEEIVFGFWLGQTEVTQAAWKKVMKIESPSRFKGDDLPANVDWNQANSYCHEIGGRLPTEREWEYAARAGTADARYGPLGAIAWYIANSGNNPHAVGVKAANAFGLHDMLGSASEWTSDNYDDGTRVVRGGSWGNGAADLRASYRGKADPTRRSESIGFRCVGEFH